MANIIKFPGANARGQQGPAEPTERLCLLKDEKSPHALRTLWVIAVLLWPLLRWTMIIDCTIQLFVAMYRWDSAPLRAGATFALHFAAFSALTYFVILYRPKGD